MSNKTIAKFCALVIASVFAVACSHATPDRRYEVDAAELSADYEKPAIVGHITSNEITESSGLAASPCQSDVLWTHNDSGDDAYVFAINKQGKHLGTWRVTGARNEDWEDIGAFKDASGACYLYIGDIGNNKLERVERRVYRVKEPAITPDAATSSKKTALPTDAAEVLAFKYPDTPHDAETMMVRPQTGDIYVLTKRMDGPSLVSKIAGRQTPASVIVAEKVGEVALPAVPNGLLTGGSISPDGTQAFVCDYSAGYVLKLGSAANFDDIWKQKPVPVDLGDRKQGEAVAFSADGRSIFATSEKKNSPVTEVRLRLDRTLAYRRIDR